MLENFPLGNGSSRCSSMLVRGSLELARNWKYTLAIIYSAFSFSSIMAEWVTEVVLTAQDLDKHAHSLPLSLPAPEHQFSLFPGPQLIHFPNSSVADLLLVIKIMWENGGSLHCLLYQSSTTMIPSSHNLQKIPATQRTKDLLRILARLCLAENRVVDNRDDLIEDSINKYELQL